MKMPRSFQRLTLSLTGVLLIWMIWLHSVELLRTFPEAAVSAFTTLTVNTQYAIAAIIIFMVTGRLVYEAKLNAVTQVVESTERLIESKRMPAPKHFDSEEIP